MLAPVVAALVARVFHRREISDFTLGVSGYPILGPVIGAIGFGLSALGSYLSLRAEDPQAKQTMSSEWTMVGFLFSLVGMIALSGLALWRIFSSTSL
jgi:hypothetical protein